jgi:hypothetical protein
MIGADTGEQLVKPVKLDRSGVVETAPSDDVLVPADGLARIGRGELPDLVPYSLASSDGHMPDVSWSNYRLPGIDDDALWDRPHVEDGIADAYGMRKLPTRPPKAVLDRTVVLSDVETERGRRVVRGDTMNGVQRILAPGIGGTWWLGHERIDNGQADTRSRADKQASKVEQAAKRETVDGWLALAVALDVGQVKTAPDGIEVARPTPQRYEVRRGGEVLGGGRTPAAATTKARRTL